MVAAMLLALLCTGTDVAAARKAAGVGRTPVMGWTTWYAFFLDVDEEKVVSTAQAIVDSGLRDAGVRVPSSRAEPSCCPAVLNTHLARPLTTPRRGRAVHLREPGRWLDVAAPGQARRPDPPRARNLDQALPARRKQRAIEGLPTRNEMAGRPPARTGPALTHSTSRGN